VATDPAEQTEVIVEPLGEEEQASQPQQSAEFQSEQ